MGIQDIKKRTKAVKNTLQITKAMELIASIKMRSAIAAVETSRAFSDEVEILLKRLSEEGKIYRHPLLNGNTSRDAHAGTSLLVVASSDKGLCGSFNTEIFRAAWEFIYSEQKNGQTVAVVTVGNKAFSHFSRAKDLEIVANFNTLGEDIEYLETTPISKLIIDEFQSGKYAKVAVSYAEFVSVMRQEATVKQILPVKQNKGEEDGIEEKGMIEEKKGNIYEFEPNPETVLDVILPQLVRMQLFQTLLESNASEHAARMVAMKNATDAGKEIVDDLEFTYNRLRQEKITSELSEIASGAQALS